MASSPDLLAGFESHKAGKLAEAERSYLRVLESDPNHADALQLLGLIRAENGQHEQALELVRRAIAVNGTRSDYFNNLGNILTQLGRLSEAAQAHRRSLELKPDDATTRSNLLVALQYHTDITLAELAAAHAEFERWHAAPLLAERQPLLIDRDPERPLVVGFVSPNFRQHPVGHFVLKPLEHIDRQQFRVICYSDGTTQDAWTSRFRALSTKWRETRGLTNVQLADQIRAERVDILFDLAGHTAMNRLLTFARRPAPIQITWGDYVGTTGLTAMDYILADRHEIPSQSERHYVERVLRLPHGYVCYEAPPYAPSVSPLPALAQGFVTFSSFNYWPKITAKVIEVWAQILQRVPNSRLLLKNGGLQDAAIAGPLLHKFSEHGITDVRIECLGWSPHAALLAEYQRVDVALDPFPYNGGLTTCEAMWMGVPVITCPGETFAGRHSLSHLTNVGVTETIARSLEEYVELAVSLATDLPRLATIRSGLRDRLAASPLCDGNQFAHDFAQLLRDVWRQRCHGSGN